MTRHTKALACLLAAAPLMLAGCSHTQNNSGGPSKIVYDQNHPIPKSSNPMAGAVGQPDPRAGSFRSPAASASGNSNPMAR